MASFGYTKAKQLGFTGVLDLQQSGMDVRVMLVMANTTADTQQDANFIADFTTLDECDGANHARQVCANQVVTRDDPNQRSEFSHDVVTFANLGVGTRQNVAAVYFQFVTNDADSVPLFYIDQGGFPFDGNGGSVTITPNADGLAQLT